MAETEIFFLKTGEWHNFLKIILSRFKVLAPKQGYYNPEYALLGEEDSDKVLFPGARMTQPLKFFLYPPKENVTQEITPPEKKTIILGVKACDLKAIKILDHIYLDPDFIDPFYKTRRENILIISDDCPKPLDSCFCTLIGGEPFPTDGFDLNLSFLEQGVLVEIGSDKGKTLFSLIKTPLSKASQEQINQRDNNRKTVTEALQERNKEYAFPLEGLSQLIEDKYDSPEWKEACETCVGCMACTNICPSCHCFLLIDETPVAPGAKSKFNIKRSWDSCQSTGFSRVAGGANPRKKLTSRFANRFHCKLQYKPRNYGIFACTGCGRCYEACQGKIDVRQVLSLVAKEPVK